MICVRLPRKSFSISCQNASVPPRTLGLIVLPNVNSDALNVGEERVPFEVRPDANVVVIQQFVGVHETDHMEPHAEKEDVVLDVDNQAAAAARASALGSS
jgi:hypothetical protein